MDKNFLYIMLSVAIVLIIVLVMSQGKGSKQPADVLSELLISPTPAINLTKQSTTVSTSTTLLKNATSSAVKILDKGLKIQDIVIGEGPEVKSGDKISIHYKGALENGTLFDSSYARGEPLETQIGVGQVIEGWDLGVIGMKVGGKRILYIPPALGYGDQKIRNIPPNSTLIFEVELISIKAT